MKSKILITAVLLVLLGLLQYKLWLSPSGIPRFWFLKSGIAQLNQDNALLQTRNDHVRAEVEDLKHGDEAIEEHARNDLGLIKPGETFYQIVQ